LKWPILAVLFWASGKNPDNVWRIDTFGLRLRSPWRVSCQRKANCQEKIMAAHTPDSDSFDSLPKRKARSHQTPKTTPPTLFPRLFELPLVPVVSFSYKYPAHSSHEFALARSSQRPLPSGLSSPRHFRKGHYQCSRRRKDRICGVLFCEFTPL
jgi:hypothetical protein